jgi:Tfp pilus assembly protein PilN
MMLVEINLLPQKEPKKVSVLVISSVLIALFLLVTAFYFYQIKTAKNDIASVDKEMKEVQKLEAELQKQQGSGTSANSVTLLKNAITWTDKNRIETIPVMRHLTSLLPERGFIQTFGYQEAGTVTLTVQFDTSREAASYLDSLNHSSWITSASLKSLNAVTDTGTTAASQTNTTAVTTNSASNSTTTTVGSNTTSTASTGTDSSILPRYTGSFEIQLNNEEIKKAIEDNKKDGSLEEGVTGS